MKLACFSHKNNPQLGIAVGKDHCLSLDTLFPTGDMAELINSGKAGWHSVKEYYEKQAANQELLIQPCPEMMELRFQLLKWNIYLIEM